MQLLKRAEWLALVRAENLQMKDEQSTASRSETFYSGALDRIRVSMIVLAVLTMLAAWVTYGWHMTVGFAVGGTVSYLNFYWLKRVVNGMADRITKTQRRESVWAVVLRFLLRYFLIGMVAYAIVLVSPASLYGLLAGLFLPVAAIACEAGYEVYIAVARGL
ncbi:MAG: ATP synthase subunit I [Acidobacteria bacterium]|nr:ATP synthase subunit I [Acidobacteriota bacterium]